MNGRRRTRDLTGPARGWDVVHVDIDSPPDVIDASAGSDGVCAVLWKNDVPVGQRWYARPALPVAGREAGSGWSSAISVPARATREDLAPFASVVVCSLNRPEQLERCLASLSALRPPPGEIVVVDNDPASGQTSSVCSRWTSVRYVAEPRRGLDFARNAGVRAAQGDYIVFCDDDVELHPAWLVRLLAPLAEQDVVASTGLVLPSTLRYPAQVLFERRSYLNKGFTARVFDSGLIATPQHGAWEVGAGANMAFRREAFMVGGFDERLDAGLTGCGGDSELWHRVLSAGSLCAYEPAAVVFHEHRQTIAQLRKQLHDYMWGHVAALFVQVAVTGHAPSRRRLLVLAVWLPRHLLMSMVRRSRIEALLAWDEFRGGVRGVLYWARARSRPGAPRLLQAGATRT